MKRYLVFAFNNYYPKGGWEDFQDSFDDLSSAHTFAFRLGSEWCNVQVVDLEEGRVIGGR